jgi:hypothetical protein
MRSRKGKPARCRQGLKAAGRACLREEQAVELTLSPNVSWHVGYAAQSLLKLPKAIQEAVEAGQEAEAALRRAADREGLRT